MPDMSDLTRYGIGVDPAFGSEKNSKDATGLALIEWHPVSGTRILHTATVKPLAIKYLGGISDLFQDTMDRIPVREIDCLTIEAGFVLPGRRHSGIMISRAGGVCAGIIGQDFGIELADIVWLMATQWRPVIFGAGANNWPTDMAKAQARLWCSALSGYDAGMSEHECEAVAIAAAGMQYQSNKSDKEK